MKHLKIFGLERTCTNVVQYLLAENFDVRLYINQLCDKHAVPVRVPKIRGAQLHFIICTKNPYAWLLSFYNYHNTKKKGLTKGKKFHDFLISEHYDHPNPISRYNGTHRWWLQFPHSFVIRQEDIVSNVTNVLHSIQTALDLTPTKQPFTTNRQRIDTGANPTEEPMNISYYNKKQYLQKISRQQLRIINNQLDPTILKKLGYRKNK